MLPGMRFYIVSIVSIFTALGIGIFIGFSVDTQEFVLDQKENITDVLETQFENLINEKLSVKEENEELKLENAYKDKYIESSYNFIIKNRLDNINIGIIETNSEYITSSIGRDLELAGAKVINLTTLNKSIVDKENLNLLISEITEKIIKGEENNEFIELKSEGYIDYIGKYDEPIDCLIVSGGSLDESIERINKIDKIIVDIGKNYNIPVIGIEKSNVAYSYMDEYKELNITTIDNVDMTIGKIAMILAMEGIPGNYGIKPSAKSIIPESRDLLIE